MSSVTKGVNSIHGKRGRILRRRSPLRQADFVVCGIAGGHCWDKNRIGRRILIRKLRHERLRSQIAGTQNLNDRSCDDGETENEFFHARRISGRLAICLSGRIPEFLSWPLSDFALQNCCNLGETR